MSSRAQGERHLAHLCALFLFVLARDVTCARIQPASAVSNSQRRIKAHPHPAVSSLATDTHTPAERKRVTDDLPVRSSPGEQRVEPTEQVGIFSRIHDKAASLLAVGLQAIHKGTTPVSTQSKTDWVLLAVGTSSFLVVAFFSTFCFMQCCMSSGKKSKSKDRKSRADTSSSTCSTVDGEKPTPRQQHTHNGRLVYEWDQTSKQAGVYIKVPEGLTRYDLDIKITARRVQVGRVGKPPFLREKTYDAIDEDTTGWRLRSNGELQILLQKEKEGHWPRVLLEREDGRSSIASTKA